MNDQFHEKNENVTKLERAVKIKNYFYLHITELLEKQIHQKCIFFGKMPH